MNIEKMRKQNALKRPCRAVYIPGFNKPEEFCILPGSHGQHVWPSTKDLTVHELVQISSVCYRIACTGISLQELNYGTRRVK